MANISATVRRLKASQRVQPRSVATTPTDGHRETRPSRREVSSRLVDDGYDFDFDEKLGLSESAHADQRARGRMPVENLIARGRELGKPLRAVPDHVPGDLGHIFDRRSGRLDRRSDIRERLTRLSHDIAGCDEGAFSIERDWRSPSARPIRSSMSR